MESRHDVKSFAEQMYFVISIVNTAKLMDWRCQLPKKSKKKKTKLRIKRKKFSYAGSSFASKAERDFAYDMDRAKIPWQYEPEKFTWFPPARKYTPDFKVLKKDGTFFYIEFKGYLRPKDRTKMRVFKQQHPEIDCRFVFMNANKKLYKGAKSTYADWAEKNNYKWAHEFIPQEWLDEKGGSDGSV